ncbi:MAG: hypothetical protein AAF316_00095 [Cyanobacteria bacterium P01_A01_bin.80]
MSKVIKTRYLQMKKSLFLLAVLSLSLIVTGYRGEGRREGQPKKKADKNHPSCQLVVVRCEGENV